MAAMPCRFCSRPTFGVAWLLWHSFGLGLAGGNFVFFPVAPGRRPGPATASLKNDGATLVLENEVLQARWRIDAGVLKPLHIMNRAEKVQLELPPQPFAIVVDGETLQGSDMSASSAGFQLVPIMPQAGMARLASRKGGWRATLDLRHANGVQVEWSAVLLDGAGYLRLSVVIRPTVFPLAFKGLMLFEGALQGGRKAGSVEGVPVVSDTFFVGYEHPQAINDVRTNGQVLCALRQERTVDASGTYQGSLVIGMVIQGQSRRSFLHYLESERAHPVRAMLHYNSWYDIGTGQPFNADAAIGRVEAIGKELAARNISLDAYLMDDGWDDPDNGPWNSHQGFGFAKVAALQQRTRDFGAGLGLWFSPFGGYHEPRQRRIGAARRAGIPVREEVMERTQAVFKGFDACSKDSPCAEGEGHCTSNEHCSAGLECFQTQTGVSPPGVDASAITDKKVDFCFSPSKPSAYLGLGIPEYYARLRGVIAEWVEGGARLLKLDGIGNPRGLKDTLAEDFEAAVSLIAELRSVSNRIFINLSTGTWASPFWLLYSDTVWRSGHDHYFEGEGVPRERWITYRDAQTYKNVVAKSPLFPLTSLMVHGVIFAKDAWDLTRPEGSGSGESTEPFTHEVRSAFGSGTMLQELYLTPSLLSRKNWDDIAAAAKWFRPRTHVLADVHWTGGDPEKGEVYGWAAWRDVDDAGDSWAVWRDADDASEGPAATLTLRNPSSTAQTMDLDPTTLFDLPVHARRKTLVLNAAFRDQRPQQLRLSPGSTTELVLQPYAVLVFDTMSTPPDAYTLWMDFLWDHAPKLFWLVLALAGGYAWHASSIANAPPPPVPIEELRRRRLEALQGRGASI